ncbi:MAG: aminotransferase class IV [Ekhidna sp.]
MRFIESILFRDGSYHNLSLHQERIDRTFSRYAPHTDVHHLMRILPDLKMSGVYKVRMIYEASAEDAKFDLEFAEYFPRKIKTLEIVKSKPIDYALKYEDRGEINNLLETSRADDIIISVNDGLTDGSYFNLAFWDGSAWFTPKNPLLKGVRRTQLIQEGKLKEREILVSDLRLFEKVSLINAMLDLGELEIPSSAILLPKNDG